jgi:hypothetical protein
MGVCTSDCHESRTADITHIVALNASVEAERLQHHGPSIPMRVKHAPANSEATRTTNDSYIAYATASPKAEMENT